MNEAELVLTKALGCQRAFLYLGGRRRLDKKTAAFLASVLRRRARQEPLQYILGTAEFMGLEFKVNKDVLIPRPETEILVETVLRYVARLPLPLRILDVGTGSGCIAVSLAKNLPRAEVHALDISETALEVARANCLAHNAAVEFIRSDLFDSAFLKPRSYDALVCNPPYIASGEFSGLQPEVQKEPRIALDGGADGLDFFRRVIRGAPGYLKERGFLFFEMGFGQSARVREIFRAKKVFEITEVIKDYNGIHRVIVARKKMPYG